MSKFIQFIKRLFIKPKIKGNIKPNGEKIYHTPESKSYNSVKSEIMFYTEEEAQKAGFRKSKR